MPGKPVPVQKQQVHPRVMALRRSERLWRRQRRGRGDLLPEDLQTGTVPVCQRALRAFDLRVRRPGRLWGRI